MSHVCRVAVVVALVAGLSRAAADPMMEPGPPPGPPPFLKEVVPPKLVMEHQQEIGLRPAQAEVIKRAMNDAQQQLVDLQWRLDAESEALGKMLEAEHVDEAAAVAKFDEVTALEQQVKKQNFRLLVRVKNQLDAEQQAKLRALRPPRFGPPGPPPPHD